MKVVKAKYVQVAHQWFKNGDHPDDGDEIFTEGEFKGQKFEGKVVRYYRSPTVSGNRTCKACGRLMNDHGYLDGKVNKQVVCPGDYIITEGKSEYYAMKPILFRRVFQEIVCSPLSKISEVCDESNNTKETIEQGRLIVDLYATPEQN
jgi:hypothetical protein